MFHEILDLVLSQEMREAKPCDGEGYRAGGEGIRAMNKTRTCIQGYLYAHGSLMPWMGS